jgi:hypothetical protein
MPRAITDTARRIAAAHNHACGGSLSGGKLVFGPDGSGGAWYSGNSSPGRGEDVIVFPVRHEHVSKRYVQDWLDGFPA